MNIFSVLYIISGIIVFKDIKKENSKRDMIIYITLMTVTLIFAFFYFRDPYQKSLIEYFMELMK